MTLVTIDDERDNAILFQASNRTSPWIGLSDQREEDLWVWDSRTSGYVNWNRGEPNDWNGNEDCVQMTTSGRWNDVNCGSRLMFFCEDRARSRLRRAAQGGRGATRRRSSAA